MEQQNALLARNQQNMMARGHASGNLYQNAQGAAHTYYTGSGAGGYYPGGGYYTNPWGMKLPWRKRLLFSRFLKTVN